MIFAAGTSLAEDPQQAIGELTQQIGGSFKDRPIDLAMVFFSPHFSTAARSTVRALQAALEPKVMIGCTGEGVIGRDEEYEGRAAISMVAAHLPNVDIQPFTIQADGMLKILRAPHDIRTYLPASSDTQLFIILADPFTTPADQFLSAIDERFPGVPVVGGMASGSRYRGGNALIVNDQLSNEGAIGVALAGEFEADIIVSQGCRPIGDPLTITSGEENVIYQLDGQAPLAVIQHIVDHLPAGDLALLQNGLFIGRAIDSDREDLGRGDYLIRGVMGVDQQRGAISVGDSVRIGEKVQFHLRDASTAEEDLEMMLLPQVFRQPPLGALLFSCNGRGTRLYDHPNGDISTVQEALSGTPVAGFFCAGEIGPIGRHNYLHGHTASLVIFRPKTERA